MKGTPSRNAEPHQKCSRRTPPTSGPRVIPPTKQLNHTPMASPICRGLWNMFLISAMVEGIRVAPAMPSRARDAINISALAE
jgi:hypothetical protein